MHAARVTDVRMTTMTVCERAVCRSMGCCQAAYAGVILNKNYTVMQSDGLHGELLIDGG